MSDNSAVTLFEKASREKLRFDSTVGYLSVEDLWDLPLTSERKANLDDLAKALAKQVKDSEVESFVVKTTKANETLQLKFDIVKHVIEVRLAENEAVKVRREAREKKDRLLELIAKKQDENLASKSVEELQQMVEAL